MSDRYWTDTGARHEDTDGTVYALYVETGTIDYAERWVAIEHTKEG